jgi:xylan 1,4-beta-xylosidase
MTFVFRGLPSSVHVTLQRVDGEHGNVLPEYAAMGSPLDPTPQVEQLNRKTTLPAPESPRLKDNRLDVHLSANTLALIARP